MARTLRDILNDVLTQSGFVKRNGFAAGTNQDDDQMVAIANKVAIEIRDYFPWTELRRTHVLQMVADQNRYLLPDDYRDLVPDSAWETQGSRRVEFPVPDGRWFLYKHTLFSDGGTIRVRKYGNEIEIHDPEGGESFTLEYISGSVIKDNSGAVKERFDNDNDTFELDDQVLVLGTQAHWAQTKMFPQAQQWMGNYLTKMNEAIGRSAASRSVGGGGNDYDWLRSRSPYTPTYLP